MIKTNVNRLLIRCSALDKYESEPYEPWGKIDEFSNEEF